MSTPLLSASDLGLLKDCFRVAQENFVFYDATYEKVPNNHDREIIGQVMAQKQAFMEAVTVILSAQHDQLMPVQPNPDSGVPDESGDPNLRAGQRFWSTLQSHEQRFNEGLSHTLAKISDATTKDLLRHHMEAAQIAVAAIDAAGVKPCAAASDR